MLVSIVCTSSKEWARVGLLQLLGVNVLCRQRLFEIRTFSQWLGVVSRLIERDPPILLSEKYSSSDI